MDRGVLHCVYIVVPVYCLNSSDRGVQSPCSASLQVAGTSQIKEWVREQLTGLYIVLTVNLSVSIITALV